MKCLLYSSVFIASISLLSISGLYYTSRIYDQPLSFNPQLSAHAAANETHPPLYEELDFQELSLPQHDASLEYPEGSRGTYFFPANTLWGVDFGDALHEHLLLAHIAYRANRSFVFTPFTWNRNLSEPYSSHGEEIVPSRIPWHAFLQGPAFGDPFPSSDPVPRAVRSEYWETVCRWPKLISSSPPVAYGSDRNLETVTDAWVKKLDALSSRCVKVVDRTPRIFQDETTKAQGSVDLFESLVQSLILKELKWSPLVESAYQQNLYALLPFAQTPSSSSTGNEMLSGLVVVHLRMGDFDIRCYNYHKQSTHVQEWFDLPGLPDKFEPPSAKTDWEARHDYYYKSCSPSFFQIIGKLKEIQDSEEGKGIRAVYLMSDGTRDYQHNLKVVLTRDIGWEFVMTSRDMKYTQEQHFVSQAVDMAIAQRAQVFIGNGFSSLSSTVLLLRTANGMPLGSNRIF